VVAETPLNQASSRSHCVFTLHIEARRAGADALVRFAGSGFAICYRVNSNVCRDNVQHCCRTLLQTLRVWPFPIALQVRRSKLHFVDLAGRERVGKSGLAAHMQLKEAKYINLSLHFLEQVSAGCWDGLRQRCHLIGSMQRIQQLVWIMAARRPTLPSDKLSLPPAWCTGHHFAARGPPARAVPQLAAHHGAA